MMARRILPKQESLPTPRQYYTPGSPRMAHPANVVGGGANAAYFEKRNPLVGVSAEFMREAGYVMPVSRLITGGTSARNDRGVSKNSCRSWSHDETSSRRGSLAEQPMETAFFTDGQPATARCVDEAKSAIEIPQIAQAHRNHRGLSLEVALKRRKEDRQPQQSLREKRRLMNRRIRTCDFSLIFAAAGILLIVSEAELTEAGYIAKDSIASVVIQCLAVLSTVALLYLVVYYHYTELKIAAIDSGTYDWRVGVTWDRIVQCSVEFCICAICPLPGGLWFDWIILKDPRHAACTPVRLDAVLSIPMFLRFYLVCRFIVLHSRQFQDAATRSIASLNYITMNFQFVFRTLIDENPLFVMTVFSLCFCVLMAWILTQCDRYSELPANRFYLNALWFVVVTYISIGYGDVIPLSYCARALAIFTGIVGKVVSSVLIAVISRQMQLTRGEIHVYNFVTDSKLAKERKHAAARVLQNLWHIHVYKKKDGRDEGRLRQHQRHFLKAIAEFRRIKWEQRRLAESNNSFIELSISQKEMSDTVWTLHRSQCILASRVTLLTERLHELTSLAAEPRPKLATIDHRLKKKLTEIGVEGSEGAINSL